MSVSALTTAMAVAAAAVPGGETPASAPAIDSASATATVTLDRKLPEAVQVTDTEQVAQLLLAQSTAPAQSMSSDQPTGSVEPTGQTQPTDSVLSTQSEEAPAPADDLTDIVVTGRRPSPDDPLEEINTKSYKVSQKVDESFVAPIAFAYEEIMPRPVRKGLRNFLHNLGEPVVFINYLLQLKPGKAAETLGRFAINSTLGLGGVIDVAKREPFNLPHRDNGFANTLGYYGVKPGPYFFLPLVGPTTLRDFIGGRLDLLLLPTAFPKVFQKREIVVPVWILSELGRRIEFEDELTQIRMSQDPYLAARTHYLQKRQAEIDALHGRGPSVTKPGAPALSPPPASSSPAKDPPRTSSLSGGLSIFGEGGYARLASGLMDRPISNLRGELALSY